MNPEELLKRALTQMGEGMSFDEVMQSQEMEPLLQHMKKLKTAKPQEQKPATTGPGHRKEKPGNFF